MLTKDDIRRLLTESETDAVEFKKAKGGVPASFWESYSAFANTDGGVVVLGVAENDGKRTIVGVSDADKMIADIWNAVNNPQRVSANVLFNHQVYKVKCGSKVVVVVEVPRAERTERPVYVGRDVFRGTFRRNGEGDYHCSQEAVEALIRDKCPETADCCLLEDMTIGDLNQESIARYRLMFGQSKPEHAWARIPDDEFLVKIGAAKKDSKGVVRPMLAGLICFGDFVTISNVLPNYFLDYRECLADGSRWTDRVAAHDATWSGNIIDFYFRIYDKITSSVKVPFRLDDRGLRINETKVHKALRELLANALIHADYHGRQGIVIEKRYSKLMFRNPGCLRMAKEAAIGGGRSDARNSRIFNIFALINIGERSGTGLSDIFSIWKEYGYEQPSITETYQPDQTTVTVQVELEEVTATTQENAVTTQEVAPKGTEVAPKVAPKTNGVAPKGDEVAPKNAVKPSGDAVKNAETAQENATTTQETSVTTQEVAVTTQENASGMTDLVLALIKETPEISLTEIAEKLGISRDGVKYHVNKLKKSIGLIHDGPTKKGRWIIVNQ